jgi:hypothetical protein
VESVQSHFPGVPIIPTIGNNDGLNHYQAPSQDRKALFYGDLFDIWFANVTANAKKPQFEEIKSTFMNGGYYRYDLSEDVSVLSLNSILMNTKNSQNET